MLTDSFVQCYGDTYDLHNLSQYNVRHCDILMYQ
jgi:hypothetical protein